MTSPRSSRRSPHPPDRWWNELREVRVPGGDGVGAAARAAGRAQAPIVRLARWAALRVAASERLQRLTIRTTIVFVAVVVIACSIGVITLNNIVIQRSAELGKLEDRRRELRTENALMSSQLARLSAPPRISRLARKRLGMEPASEMPAFIWLDPASKPVARRRAQRQEGQP